MSRSRRPPKTSAVRASGKVAWVVATRAGSLKCRRCETTQVPDRPLDEIEAAAARARFEDRHRHCSERRGGDG